MKWEYKARVLEHGVIIQDVLNKYGDDGWELVAVNIPHYHLVCYFKRPKSNDSIQWRDK